MLPIINFVKTHPDAVLPFKKRKASSPSVEDQIGDAGFDLVSVVDIVVPRMHMVRTPSEIEPIPMLGAAIVDVGLKVGFIQPGWWFRIEGRSGLGFNHGIFPHFGIIDNQYRGSLGVKLYNSTCVDYVIKKGDRIAQIVPYPNQDFELSFIDTPVASDRGEKGFGESGR